MRTVGSTVEAMYGRRERAGVKRSDRAIAVATRPWHLLRSVVGLVPSLVVAGSVVVILVGVSWWLVGNDHWAVGGSPSGQEPQGLTATILVGSFVLLGAAVVWWGPLSLMTRTGARRVLAAVAPGPLGALVATVVLLAAASVFIVQILTGGPDHLGAAAHPRGALTVSVGRFPSLMARRLACGARTLGEGSVTGRAQAWLHRLR